MFLFLRKLASLLVARNPLVSFTLFFLLKTRVYTLLRVRRLPRVPPAIRTFTIGSLQPLSRHATIHAKAASAFPGVCDRQSLPFSTDFFGELDTTTQLGGANLTG
uniref:Putative secreted protein n=1 Tax=Ixodes ricinus TaxID=34613 RepID=A0A6B0U8H1_IXORI